MPGTLIVSLDFELFWGMLDVCPLDDYREHVLGGRRAIPELLALFEKYGIHATWAAEGDFRDPTSFVHHGAHPMWHVLVSVLLHLGLPLPAASALRSKL